MSNLVNGVVAGVGLGQAVRRDVRQAELDRERLEQINLDQAHQAQVRPLEVQQYQQAIAARQADQAYLEKVRPMQLSAAELSLAEQQELKKYNAQVRPMSLEATQLQLDEARNNQAYQEKSRPLSLEAAQLEVEGKRFVNDKQKVEYDYSTAQRAKQEKIQLAQQLAPSEYQRFQRTGKFSDRFLQVSEGTALSPFQYLDPTYTDTVYQAQQYMDPNNASANPFTDPKVLDVANQLFKSELNNGGVNPETGLPIVEKRIVGLYPATGRDGQPIRGQMFAELEMVDNAGNKYTAPVTQGRSSDPNDPLATIDVGKLVGRVNSQAVLASAIEKTPNGKQWLQEQATRFNAQGQSKLKADEVLWQNRPQKADAVYKQFTDNPVYTNKEEGVNYVDYADFEWTGGDKTKLRFLNEVAQRNAAVHQEAKQLLREDPAQAQKHLQENWVHPDEAWAAKEQLAGQRKQGDPKNDAMLERIKTGNAAEAVKADPTAELMKQPDWHLSPSLSTDAAKQLNSEQWQQRTTHLNQQRESAETQKTTQQQQALQYAQTELPKLPKAEQREWFVKNFQHIADTSLRKQLDQQTRN